MSDELASYAVEGKKSPGRKFPEKPHPYRSDFERDRDRIIHCSAFRRLEGKTQVFTPGLDDYYRTRLTHSIEVAQIGRTIAKELRLNVNLTEAICLAHDLGHPPFGHAGEEALNNLMSDFDGFEHNSQSLRIVDLLEHPYPDFFGLNLMFETRLGLAKHSSTYDEPDKHGLEARATFLDKHGLEARATFLNKHGLEARATFLAVPSRAGSPCYVCSLEGQVADIADRIAYNCHDLEDGARAGLLTEKQLKKIQIVIEAQNKISADSIDDTTIRRTRTAKAIIDYVVSDCIEASRKALKENNIRTLEDVYGRNDNLITLSAESDSELTELEKFLLENFYQNKSLLQTSGKVKIWLEQLFEMLCQKPKLMPGYFQRFIENQGLQRTVCDYIAGMTDRFCLNFLEKNCKEKSHIKN